MRLNNKITKKNDKTTGKIHKNLFSFMKTNSVQVFENHWLPLRGLNKHNYALLEHTHSLLKAFAQKMKLGKAKKRSQIAARENILISKTENLFKYQSLTSI